MGKSDDLLTQHEFAIQHGVRLSSLSKWLSLERDDLPPKVKFQKFVCPIQLSNSHCEIIRIYFSICLLEAASYMVYGLWTMQL